MDKRTIEEIKKDIDKVKEEIADIEIEIDDLQSDLASKEYDKEYLENKYGDLLNELYTQYPIMNFVDESREDISGQFTRDGKWRVCNGYVLLESKNKFDILKETNGINTTFEELMKDRERIDISMEDICEENDKCKTNGYRIKLGGYLFNQGYVNGTLDIMGRENVEGLTVYVNKDYTGKSGNLHIKTKDMQAIILGVREV